MLPSVRRNVDVLIQAGPWIQAGVWRNCTNRGLRLLFDEIRRHRPRPHCIRQGPRSPRKRHNSPPPLFGRYLWWPRSPISANAELLLHLYNSFGASIMLDVSKTWLYGAIRLSDQVQDSQWIWVQIHLANRMTLGLSNVSRIQFGFRFIVNPGLDPIIEYALCMMLHTLYLLIWTDFSSSIYSHWTCGCL